MSIEQCSCIMYLLYKSRPRDATFSLHFTGTGFYCPLEGSTPVPCPKGTYGPTVAALSADSCLQCPPHHYCPEPGLVVPKACGSMAHQPLSGQESCTCLGQGQNFQVCFTWVSAIPYYIMDASCQWLLHRVSRRSMCIQHDSGCNASGAPCRSAKHGTRQSEAPCWRGTRLSFDVRVSFYSLRQTSSGAEFCAH